MYVETMQDQVKHLRKTVEHALNETKHNNTNTASTTGMFHTIILQL